MIIITIIIITIIIIILIIIITIIIIAIVIIMTSSEDFQTRVGQGTKTGANRRSLLPLWA